LWHTGLLQPAAWVSRHPARSLVADVRPVRLEPRRVSIASSTLRHSKKWIVFWQWKILWHCPPD